MLVFCALSSEQARVCKCSLGKDTLKLRIAVSVYADLGFALHDRKSPGIRPKSNEQRPFHVHHATKHVTDATPFGA